MSIKQELVLCVAHHCKSRGSICIGYNPPPKSPSAKIKMSTQNSGKLSSLTPQSHHHQRLGVTKVVILCQFPGEAQHTQAFPYTQSSITSQLFPTLESSVTYKNLLIITLSYDLASNFPRNNASWRKCRKAPTSPLPALLHLHPDTVPSLLCSFHAPKQGCPLDNIYGLPYVSKIITLAILPSFSCIINLALLLFFHQHSNFFYYKIKQPSWEPTLPSRQ